MSNYLALAKMIDHALLSPTLSIDDMHAGVELALAYDVASVCIMPSYLKWCTDALAGSTVLPSTVIGFPLGGQTTEVKRAEALQAIADGGQELDMVVNISRVISGHWGLVRDDIAAVVEVAHAAERKVKVIFENCYLNDDQKIQLCGICSDLNVDWVKTSTGFGTGGATAEDLKLMREHAADHIQVKAAGGVGDLDTLMAFRDIGVTRCGASRTATILDGLRADEGLPPVTLKSAGSKSTGY